MQLKYVSVSEGLNEMIRVLLVSAKDVQKSGGNCTVLYIIMTFRLRMIGGRCLSSNSDVVPNGFALI